ncbi:MAG: hypothetical protein M3Z95_04715 [Actinomycetota bacterium]|nr:hypothetical protein [Actinomycetota bacterium]
MAGRDRTAWLLRGGRPSRWLVVFVGAALTFWGLTGAAYVYGRAAAASRYQLVDAALLILIAAELFRTVRLRPWQTAAVAAVALFALASNVDTLVNYGFGRLRDESAYAKADLGALEITRGVVPRRRITLVDPVARHPFLAGVTSDRYLSETEAHGSPVHYSAAQLATGPPAQRQAADNVLAVAYSIVPRRARRPDSRNGCRRFPGRSRDARAEVEIPSGGALLTDLDAPPLVVYVRRFAPSNHPVAVGFLAGRSTSRLAIPRDSALLPWRVTVSGMSAVEICPQRAQ